MQAIQGIILIIGVVFAHSVSAGPQLSCGQPVVKIPEDWLSMVKPCIKKMREQVQEELTASMTYMAMGAHFARDTVNRPGFSKMFFESASEEREHAIKIIEYLLMRGDLTSDIKDLIKDPRPLASSWASGVDALKAALKLEVSVTDKIQSIIKVCEQPPRKVTDGETAEETAKLDLEYVPVNDYHLVDYLTGDFLEEQYRGQRDIAGKISTLQKMMASQGPLGEFLFDKKLLNGTPI